MIDKKLEILYDPHSRSSYMEFSVSSATRSSIDEMGDSFW